MNNMDKSALPANAPITSDEPIGSVVRMRRFAPVVDLQWAEIIGGERNSGLIENYIVTEELDGYFETVMEGFTLQRHEKRALRAGNITDPSTVQRSFLIRGQYGTGKSYFLLMMSALLESLANERLYDELQGKFRMFEGIRFHLEKMKQTGRKYLIVHVDGVKNIDTRFSELIQKCVISKIDKKIGIHDFSGSYTIALQKLDEYRKDPVLSELLHKELDAGPVSYDSLVSGLTASQRSSLNQYRELMRKITHHRIDEGFDSLEAFLKEASAYVKGCGYAGIVILFDEFSAYINASIEDRRITADLAAIQSLAQLTVPGTREECDIVFLCSMHVDIGAVLGNIMAAADEIQKVRGRFVEMTLNFSNNRNLVENILIIDSEAFSRIKGKYAKYFGAIPHRYPGMEKVYPIHPQTVGSIIRVAGKFAQSERTVFSFFSETVNRKIGEPVVKEGRLNLITATDIYDYFIEFMTERDQALKDSALRCISFCRDELEKDVVKALVIACVSKGEDADSRLSPMDIAFILGVDEIQRIDAFLKELSANPGSNILYYAKEYKFEFIAAGNAAEDLNARIDSEAAKLNAYDAFLNALEDYSASICIRKSFTVHPSKDTLPVKKDLVGVVLRPPEFLGSRSIEMAGGGKDGMIIFIIPGFEEEIGRDFTDKAKDKLHDADSNICAAIPGSLPSNMEKDLRYYEAVKNIIRMGMADENGRKLLNKVFQSLQKVVEREILRFGNCVNFTFVFNNNETKAGFQKIDELEAFLLARHFYKFPKVDAESVRGKNAVFNLIDGFLAFGEKGNIPANYTSEADKLIMDVLRPLDMVKADRNPSGFSAILKIPESANNPVSHEIWSIVTDTDRPVADIFAALGKAPYGLPDYMVELYIAAAVAANQLEIRYRGQYVPLSRSSITYVDSAGYSLEKVKSASVELKKKVKTIWLLLDRIYKSHNAGSYSPELPQSDIETCSYIMTDIAGARTVLEGLAARLEHISVKYPAITAWLAALDEAGMNRTAVDFFEAFVEMPQRITGAATFEAAVADCIKTADFITGLNNIYGDIKKIDECLNELVCIKGIGKGFEGIKTGYFDIDQCFSGYKSGLGSGIIDTEEFDDIKARLEALVSEYNDAFAIAHENLRAAAAGLYKLFDKPDIKLIECMEKVSLANIKSVKQIRGDLHGIDICRIKDLSAESGPLSCSCYEEGTGLAGLLDRIDMINMLSNSIARQVANIGSNYFNGFIGLDSVNDGGNPAFTGYLGAFSPDDLNKAGPAWERLKVLLNEGFARTAAGNCDKACEEISILAPYINKYLELPVPDPKTANSSAGKRRVPFRDLYSRIEKSILDSGYKTVPLDELERSFKKMIEEAKKDFDEVEI